MSFEDKFFLIDSYFIASFNYFALVWMLSSVISLRKKKLQKRALTFLCNGSEVLYEELVSNPATSLMNLKRLRALCIGLYRAINNLSLNFMLNLFKLRLTNRHICEKYKMNMIILEFNEVFYGKKSLRILDSKL